MYNKYQEIINCKISGSKYPTTQHLAHNPRGIGMKLHRSCAHRLSRIPYPAHSINIFSSRVFKQSGSMTADLRISQVDV